MERLAESLRPSTEQVRLPALGTSASAVAVGQKQGWLNTWVGKGFVKAGYPPKKGPELVYFQELAACVAG